MTFQEQQKQIGKCYQGYYNDGFCVSRSFGRSRFYDKRFLQELNDNKKLVQEKQQQAKMITK